MCCETELICLIFAAITIASIVIGAPLWGVASARNYYSTTNGFISVPIFPETEGGFEKYGAVVYVPGQEFYPDLETYSISITSHNLFNGIDDEIDLYLFHNLWGINYSLDVLNSEQSILFSHSYSVNFNRDQRYDYSVLTDEKLLKDIAGDLVTDDFIYLYCPYPTLFTRNLKIDNYCRNEIYPVKSLTKYTQTQIGTNVFSENSNLTFRFNFLEAYPKDFIETPQIIIGGYKSTNKQSLLISGIFFSVLGIVLFIIGAVLILFMEVI